MTAALAVLVAAGLAGCAGPVAGRPVPAPGSVPTPTQAQWVDELCTADALLASITDAAQPDPGALERAAVVDYLTAADSGIKSVRAQVAALPPAPFPGGDTYVAAYLAGLDQLEPELAAHAAEAAAAVIPPITNLYHPLRQAEGELANFSVLAPGLLVDPAYAAAYHGDARCR